MQWALMQPNTCPGADPGDFSPSAATKPGVETQSIPPAPTAAKLRSLSPAGRLASLAAALPHMTVNDLAPLVETLTASREETSSAPDFASDALLRLLFSRWVELDAPGMMAALETPAYRYAPGARGLAVLTWAEVRGISALEAVQKKWPALARSAAILLLQRQPGMMESLIPFLTGSNGCEDDPLYYYAGGASDAKEALGAERTLRLAAAINDEEMLHGALNALAREDFPRAFQSVKALPDGPMRDEAMKAFLNDLAAAGSRRDSADTTQGKDGLTFHAEYEALPADSILRETLATEYAEWLGSKDPGAAVKWAHALRTGKLRSEALESIARGIPPDRPDTATQIFASAWLADPSHHLAEYSAENNHGRVVGSHFGPSEVASSFYDWLKGDPPAAEAWLKTVTDVELRAELATCVTDPSRVVSLMPSSEYRLKAAMDLIHPNFPLREPQPNAVPADLQRPAALYYAMLWGASDDDWHAATTGERRLLSADAVKSKAAETAMAGVEFFNSLPLEERSPGAYYEAGAAYLKESPEEASAWMESLPPGPERDAAATALIESLTAAGDDRDGAAAFAWAASMSGDIERTRYLSKAAQTWAAEDPAAAREAVAASALPDGEKLSLLNKLPAPPSLREGGAR